MDQETKPRAEAGHLSSVIMLIIVTISLAAILKAMVFTGLSLADQHAPGDRGPGIDSFIAEEGMFIPLDGVVAVRVSNNSPDDLEGYQVRALLTGSLVNWSASPTSVYVTDLGDNPLYYWLEEWDPGLGRAVLWFKIPFLPAHSSQIYLIYYGGANPYTSYNSPTDVFVFFDDFDVFNTSLWTQPGNYTHTPSLLRVNTGSAQAPVGFDLAQGYSVDVRARYEEPASSAAVGGSVPAVITNDPDPLNQNGDSVVALYRDRDGSMSINVAYGNATGFSLYSYRVLTTGPGEGEWFVGTVALAGSVLTVMLNYSALYGDASVTWYQPLLKISLGYWDNYGAYDIQDTTYDWVRVRKYVHPEPQVHPFKPGDLVVYVRNIGSSELHVRGAYLYRAGTGELLSVGWPVGDTVVPPGTVEPIRFIVGYVEERPLEVLVVSSKGATSMVEVRG